LYDVLLQQFLAFLPAHLTYYNQALTFQEGLLYRVVLLFLVVTLLHSAHTVYPLPLFAFESFPAPLMLSLLQRTKHISSNRSLHKNNEIFLLISFLKILPPPRKRSEERRVGKECRL